MTVFFFNDTATTEIYTLSLHDALPISGGSSTHPFRCPYPRKRSTSHRTARTKRTTMASITRISSMPIDTSYTIKGSRSEEHTSELQSRQYLVCRLLLEKKKQ